MLKHLSYSVTFPATNRQLAADVEFKQGFGVITCPNESGKCCQRSTLLTDAIMLAYHYGGPDSRTSRIKDRDGKMIVEILGSRVNIIVPPSIHPDTGLAYTENKPLYEIPRSELPVLSSDIDERIRTALRAAGVELGLEQEGCNPVGRYPVQLTCEGRKGPGTKYGVLIVSRMNDAA